ncbi:flagellar hook-basal body protein [Aquabacterium humicola]|uniref:flagellar hook-basal body protein n=1 Tax=Aquabacterium humicola TaxID=3237377 RepID=UPI002543B9AA|nr:flagellar hook-basal body complex protein [Rubrivivax pictus]
MIAAASLAMQQRNLETIAGNLANISTPGYKATRLSFAEVVRRTSASGADGANGPIAPGGVAVAGTDKDFSTAGDLKPTGSAMDLAINGRGFLEVSLADGSRAFTRGGSLTINKDSMLTTQAGLVLKPEISVPADATRINITPEGRVMVQVPGHAGELELGRLELAAFVNPGGLKALGDGLYVPTGESGEALAVRAGEDGIGTLAQGALEQSNVQMNNEMVALMKAQRAYELSARVLQVSDGIMAATNELLRR